MGTVYAVVNQKGGVGKTTTVVNVAAFLALAGRRTLVVDLDPQGNATSGLGIDKQQVGTARGRSRPSIYDVLVNGAEASSAIVATVVAGLDVLPANIDLAGAEQELIGAEDRETTLRRALDPLRSAYDILLTDAPPSLGLLTVNALAAADRAIVPIQCEYYALEGVSQLIPTIELVRQRINPGLEIALVIMTMFDNRVRSGQQVVEEVRRAFRDKVSKTLIPRNVRLAEAPSHGLPAALYDPRSRGAAAYKELAQEVMQIEQERAR